MRAALRAGKSLPVGVAESAIVGEIDGRTDWTEALRGGERVLHLAARAHGLAAAGDAEGLYVETNSKGTERLAAESARLGIRRIVFLSSVKVNGEESASHSFSASDEPRPQDAYGRSKWLAEQRLWSVVAGTFMEAAVVRSPLVYGAGVRANFLRLLRWIDRELPRSRCPSAPWRIAAAWSAFGRCAQ